jgi:hypothetical protein
LEFDPPSCVADWNLGFVSELGFIFATGSDIVLRFFIRHSVLWTQNDSSGQIASALSQKLTDASY